jgi:hypothetical protein
MKPLQSLIGVAAILAAATGSAFAADCAARQRCNEPEPGALALLGLAIGGAALVSRRK